MTFYIVTMVGPGPQKAPRPSSSERPAAPGRGGGGRPTSDRLCSHTSTLPLEPPRLPGQVVMTIIVAFILEAFVFRMNYSRKNQDSEGLCKERPPPSARLSVCLSSVSWWAGWQSSCLGAHLPAV